MDAVVTASDYHVSANFLGEILIMPKELESVRACSTGRPKIPRSFWEVEGETSFHTSPANHRVLPSGVVQML